MKNQFRTNEFLEMLIRDISKQKSFTQYHLEEWKVIQSGRIQELKQLLKLEELDYAYTLNLDCQEMERFFVNPAEVIKSSVKLVNTLTMAIYFVYPKEANGKTINICMGEILSLQ